MFDNCGVPIGEAAIVTGGTLHSHLPRRLARLRELTPEVKWKTLPSEIHQRGEAQDEMEVA
jgi:hypothetical protein